VHCQCVPHTQEQLLDFSADDVTFRYRRCAYAVKGLAITVLDEASYWGGGGRAAGEDGAADAVFLRTALYRE